MNDWEEISFSEVEGKGLFKFTYFFDGTTNNGDAWAECIENDEETDIYVQELFINLLNKKRISNLRAWKSVAEYK